MQRKRKPHTSDGGAWTDVGEIESSPPALYPSLSHHARPHRCSPSAYDGLRTALLVAATILCSSPVAASTELWEEVPEPKAALRHERRGLPDSYRTVRLDLDRWQKLLDGIVTAHKSPAGIVLPLPMPDGSSADFLVENAPIMAPGLAKKFPHIQTMVGYGIDAPYARARLDWTDTGFHAQILHPGGTVYVDPYTVGDRSLYLSYNKRDLPQSTLRKMERLPPVDPGGKRHRDIEDLVSRQARNPVGENLRTYRLAVATTGEYASYHGGGKSGALSAVVTTINRVTGIYETELSIRLELIANNDSIIYTNAGSDPYSNYDAISLIYENQANLDAVIGSANYDIGHVFSTGGGGVAGLGVVCDPDWKARGETGLSYPEGDAFDVDYVAHEMGHQFGANHTFNGDSGSCSSSNRNASTAYEPGSGSTIMAYAGICSPQNIQWAGDAYFHAASHEEIFAYTNSGGGANCGKVESTGNRPPIPDAGPRGFTIPSETPFALQGSASDPDGDPLTYGWEQFDLGPSGAPENPKNNAPLFRSFEATASPTRTFPQWSDLLNETSTMGEVLPSKSRNLNFRFTVRDGRGGVAYDETDLSVHGSSGPFRVTEPTDSSTWNAGSVGTVTWNTAGTSSRPVNCAAVDIHLSTDGNTNFDTVLSSGTENDGEATISVPALTSNRARVRVRCSSNVFFALSPGEFRIRNGAGPTCGNNVVESGESCDGDDAAGCPGACTASCTCAAAVSACGENPRSDCRAALADKASLVIVNKPKDSKDKLSFQWKGVESLALPELLTPTSPETQIDFCLYTDAGLVTQNAVSGGGTCKKKPCWKNINRGPGYKYEDTQALQTGAKVIVLRSGEPGKAIASLLTRGENAGVPSLPLVGPARAQLVVRNLAGAETCLEANFTSPKKSTSTLFKAKSQP